MSLNINTIETCTDIPKCMTAEEIGSATLEYYHISTHISVLSVYVTHGWPPTRAEVIKDIQPYWYFRDDVLFINRTTMKYRRIIIPASLQKSTLDQLHVNHMGIEKIRLLHMNPFTG